MLLDRLLWLYLIENKLAHWIHSYIIESRHFQDYTRMEHCTTQPPTVELVISTMIPSAASVNPVTVPLSLGGLNCLYHCRHHLFPCAKCSQRNVSLLQEADHPCRPQLTIYQQVDLLNSYIVPVIIPISSTPLLSVSLDQCVLSKAVIVSVSDKHYAIG